MPEPLYRLIPNAPDLSGRRVLVTGATGLLGREVVSRLIESHAEVVAICRTARPIPNCKVVAADLAGDFSACLRSIGDCDSIIHLAQAPGWRQAEANAASIVAIAYGATKRLCDFAARQDCTAFVFASTGGLYSPSPVPIRESDSVKHESELNPYFRSKWRAEQLLDSLPTTMTVHKLRYFFIYGPGQSDAFMLMAGLRRMISEGRTITLARGTGARHNPVFVTDAAQATIAALTSRESATVNVAGKEAVDIRGICDIISAQAGRQPVYQHSDALPADLVADIGRMTSGLSRPVVGIADGVSLCF